MSLTRLPLRLVCFYDEKDEEFWLRLKSHLDILQSQGLISIWDKNQILPGLDRNAEIQKQLEAASIILLLLSSEFLSHHKDLIDQALQKQTRAGVSVIHVVPVMLRYVNLKATAFGKAQILPRDGKPVFPESDLDSVFSEVSQIIQQLAGVVQSSSSIAHPTFEPSIQPLADAPSPSSDAAHPAFEDLPPPRRSPKARPTRLLSIISLLIALVLLIGSFSIPVFHGSLLNASHPPSPTATIPVTVQQGDAASSLIPAGKAPTINDPLNSAHDSQHWNTGNTAEGSCQFVPGQYLLLTAPQGAANVVDCTAGSSSSILGNFVYQIRMTILAGLGNDQSWAGPTFRINTNGNGQQYQVNFDANGDWQVATETLPLCSVICSDASPYFHTGLHRANFITIRASGSHIQVQINGHLLDSFTDATYASGFIGVEMAPGTQNSSVAFSDLRVWQL